MRPQESAARVIFRDIVASPRYPVADAVERKLRRIERDIMQDDLASFLANSLHQAENSGA